MFANIITGDKLESIIKNNPVLKKDAITVKRAINIDKNLYQVKLSIKYGTRENTINRDATAFIYKSPNGEEYTFVGGGFSNKRGALKMPLDTNVIEQGKLFSIGEGNETINIVSNPSCPWCTKLEEKASKSNFYKKYTVNVYLMPFHSGAVEKTYWILNAKSEKDKSDRFKKVMNGDLTWKDFKPTIEEKTEYEALIKKSLNAAKELGATGTPTVYDSKFNKIDDWPSLMREQTTIVEDNITETVK
jgi:protein-disulfide isomerase